LVHPPSPLVKAEEIVKINMAAEAGPTSTPQGKEKKAP